MGWWLILLAIGLAGAEEICLAGDEDPYLLFGSKTSYIFANRGLPNVKTHEIPGKSSLNCVVVEASGLRVQDHRQHGFKTHLGMK